MEQKKTHKRGRKPTGRLVEFKTVNIAGRKNEIEQLKNMAAEAGKSVSCYVLTSLGIRQQKAGESRNGLDIPDP